ncbi:MAG: PilT/PilU family type 4a pilus ATPase [Deltaproteobacteria bacterium]|nr:PilT/PilU family type 4a pilus ATPase [Deltaproteobacteria bacterium]
MPKIDGPLKQALKERASDIHISSDEPIRIRVDGDLQVLLPERLTPQGVTELLYELLSDDEKQRFEQGKNLDKSINIAEAHFRVNMFFTRRGPAAVLRTIPKTIPTMADLNLPPAIGKLTDLPKGLVLVTGPTGSGKSTTLASMLHHINLTYGYHILTVEDPVEFVHESRSSLINQREIGASCHTFADALKYALREDPDVILVGEMRDLETIGLALTAAETGHLVFGTLHTRGAAASVDRIIDSFPANQQAMIRTMLSESLAAVISQCLIKKAEGRGRVAAYEILIVNTAIANLIREGKTFQMPSIIQTSKKEGMVLMEQSILELVQKKIVRAEDAAPYLDDPAILGPLLRAAPSGNTSPSISIRTQTQSSPSIKPIPMSGKPPAPPSVSAPSIAAQAPPTPAKKFPPATLAKAPPVQAETPPDAPAVLGLDAELISELPSNDSVAQELEAPSAGLEETAPLDMEELSDPSVMDSLELTDSPVSGDEIKGLLTLAGETVESVAVEVPAAPPATVPKSCPPTAPLKPAPAAIKLAPAVAPPKVAAVPVPAKTTPPPPASAAKAAPSPASPPKAAVPAPTKVATPSPPKASAPPPPAKAPVKPGPPPAPKKVGNG